MGRQEPLQPVGAAVMKVSGVWHPAEDAQREGWTITF
jgi:hypothetical protein